MREKTLGTLLFIVYVLKAWSTPVASAKSERFGIAKVSIGIKLAIHSADILSPDHGSCEPPSRSEQRFDTNANIRTLSHSLSKSPLMHEPQWTLHYVRGVRVPSQRTYRFHGNYQRCEDI